MKKWNIFKGEDWLGCVMGENYDAAMTAAAENPEFAGFTHAEERSENTGHSGAQ